MLCLQMHRVVIHTFERRVSKPYVWKSKTLEFQTAVSRSLASACKHPSIYVLNTWQCQTIASPICIYVLQQGEGAADWAAVLRASMRKLTDRPRSLLVFLNPFGGARQAQAVWDKVACPIMLLAGKSDCACRFAGGYHSDRIAARSRHPVDSQAR